MTGEDATMMPLVTITGVTGFLGGRTALAFLSTGRFRVRGTVRSLKNPEKLAPLKKLLGEGDGGMFPALDLVEADLTDPASLGPAVASSTFVVHTASPFVMGVKAEDEDTMVKPAVEGTRAVLRACKAAGTVKRVVVTSSCASIFAMDPKDKPSDDTYDETMWSNPDRPGGLLPYTKSKTLAERAVWDFVNKDEPGCFEAVTIHPTFIMGPTTINNSSFESGAFMKKMMTGGFADGKVPRSHMHICDVRNVADAHVKAVEVPEAAGERFLVHSACAWMKEFADILADKYEAESWPIPREEIPNPDAEENHFRNEKAAKVLGIEYYPLKDTLIDMAESMIESGFISKP